MHLVEVRVSSKVESTSAPSCVLHLRPIRHQLVFEHHIRFVDSKQCIVIAHVLDGISQFITHSSALTLFHPCSKFQLENRQLEVNGPL